MTLFNIRVGSWCFLFGAVILCGYTHYNSMDLAPIIGSWLLMLGAFFGWCDEFNKTGTRVSAEDLFGTRFRETSEHQDSD